MPNVPCPIEQDSSHHDEVELRPRLTTSLAELQAKLNADSDVPSFVHRLNPFSSSSSPTASPSSTCEVGDNDVTNDDCAVTTDSQSLGGPDSYPSPTITPAITDTITTSSSTAELEGSYGERGIYPVTPHV